MRVGVSNDGGASLGSFLFRLASLNASSPFVVLRAGAPNATAAAASQFGAGDAASVLASVTVGTEYHVVVTCATQATAEARGVVKIVVSLTEFVKLVERS